jgi:hypothetical protein
MQSWAEITVKDAEEGARLEGFEEGSGSNACVGGGGLAAGIPYLRHGKHFAAHST